VRVLVIGGTAFIGPQVVTRLIDLGHSVALLNRGRTPVDLPESVQRIRSPAERLGDRGYLSTLRDRIREFDPDVVLDMIAVVESDATALMESFRNLAGRVVVISSQDVYRAYGVLIGVETGPIEPVPFDETGPLRSGRYPYRADTPRETDDPRVWMDDYDKIPIEKIVMNDPDLPGTVLRLPMVYGPRDKQHRMFEYLKRMLDGRPAILLEKAVSRWRWTRAYVENVADAIVLAVTREEATGRIYNVGEPETLTTREWVERIAAAMEWSGDIIEVAGETLPEALRAQGRTDQDLVTQSNRIREDLGYAERVELTEAIARTVAWERDNPPAEEHAPKLDYEAEDAVLAGISRPDPDDTGDEAIT